LQLYGSQYFKFLVPVLKSVPGNNVEIWPPDDQKNARNGANFSVLIAHLKMLEPDASRNWVGFSEIVTTFLIDNCSNISHNRR